MAFTQVLELTLLLLLAASQGSDCAPRIDIIVSGATTSPWYSRLGEPGRFHGFKINKQFLHFGSEVFKHILF